MLRPRKRPRHFTRHPTVTNPGRKSCLAEGNWKALCNLPLDPTSGSVFASDTPVGKCKTTDLTVFLQVATRHPSPTQRSGGESASLSTPTISANRTQRPATSCTKHMGEQVDTATGYCVMSRVARFSRFSSSKPAKSAVQSPQRKVQASHFFYRNTRFSHLHAG
jgi:hypothetical protein